MTAADVKRQIEGAVSKRDATQCLALCEEIVKKRLYIGEPVAAQEDTRRLTLTYPGRCMGCGKTVPVGATALWKKHVGVWHTSCGGNQ